MKTTVDLPEDLLIRAKIRAARERRTLKELIEAGLRRALAEPGNTKRAARGPIRWVTADGGLPAGVDGANRETLSDLLRRPM